MPTPNQSAKDIRGPSPLVVIENEDDAPWHFINASGETIVVVGLSPGAHEVLVQLADPTHRVIASHTVRFVVPDLRKAAVDHGDSAGNVPAYQPTASP